LDDVFQLGAVRMSAAPPPLSVATAPAAPPATSFIHRPEPAAGWPRSAQLALAALLGLATGLLAWHVCSMQRWGSRPTDLDTSPRSFLRLDLNRADRAQLLQLPGVGDSLARRIEAYRAEHHGFHAVDELRHVSGIGPTMLERLRPFVYVEGLGEEGGPATRLSYYSPPAVPANPSAAATEEKKPTTKKSDGPKDRINVNEATASQLQQLPHVGPKLSSRIVEARDKKPFQTVEDLRRVPGIGAKTLDSLRPYVTVEPSARVETNP
jgi:competence ComEA-like helix-hairpin-helix protein